MVKTCEDFDIRQRSGEMIPGNIGAYSFDCPVDISEGDSDRNEQDMTLDQIVTRVCWFSIFTFYLIFIHAMLAAYPGSKPWSST